MKPFLRRIEVLAWAVTIFVFVASVGMGLIFYKDLPPEVPLFYSLPWGEGQLVPPYTLAMLPGIALAIGLGVNVFHNRLLKDPILAALTLLTGSIVQLVLILSLLRILLLVS